MPAIFAQRYRPTIRSRRRRYYLLFSVVVSFPIPRVRSSLRFTSDDGPLTRVPSNNVRTYRTRPVSPALGLLNVRGGRRRNPTARPIYRSYIHRVRRPSSPTGIDLIAPNE